MKCKSCGLELDENQSVCPACGEYCEVNQTEETVEAPAKMPMPKKQKMKLAFAIIAGVLVVALLAGILVLALRKNDVYYKSSYAASDFWADAGRNMVVATMGDYKLTNGQFQVFYWMQVYDLVSYYVNLYGDYATYYMGLDLEEPFSEQIYNQEVGMTWEQYFIEDAFYAWHRYQALADEAAKNGYKLSAEYEKYFDDLKPTLEKSAKEGGYASVDEMLQEDLGTCVTFDDYYHYLRLYYISNLYFDELVAGLTFTDAEMEAHYEENKEQLAKYNVSKDSGVLVDLRNIFVKPIATKDANGNSVITDEAWEDCRVKAQAILDQWLSGEKSEDSFAQLAEKKSEDEDTAEQGGLMQHVAKNTFTTVDVRHILVTPQGGTKSDDGKTITYSDAEWEACRAEAQSILDEWLAGDKTEASFGDLANKHSDDNGGKVTNGGIYTNVNKGDMVANFDAWIFDSSRQVGDTGLVKTEFGYHVMYFVHRDGAMEDWAFSQDRKVGDAGLVKTDDGYQILYYVADEEGWIIYCREGLINKTSMELMESCAESHPVNVRYWATVVSQPTRFE